MSLVAFTWLVGLALAPGHMHPVLAGAAVLCIAVGGGAAGALNMWYERDIDSLMRRTAGRPLPAGRMMPGEALGFGGVLATGAVLVMGLAANWVAAELLALIFFWTPPHFWALSLYRSGDYATAGVPMLPVVAGPRQTKRQMLLYTLLLWPVTAAPWLLGVAGSLYGAGAVLLNGVFTGVA